MRNYRLLDIIKKENNKYDIVAPLYEMISEGVNCIADAEEFIKKRIKKQTIKKNFSAPQKAKDFLDKYLKDIPDYSNFELLYNALLKESDDLALIPRLCFYKKDFHKEFPYKIPYYFCHTKNRYLKFGFATTNQDSYSYLSGKIAVDFAERFDKWSKCPFIIPLPSNKEELELLLDGIYFCFYTEDGESSYKKEEWTWWSDKTIDSYEKLKNLLEKYNFYDTNESNA